MKSRLIVGLLAGIAMMLSGCTNFGSVKTDPNAYARNRMPGDSGIFHDYDYRSDGTVSPYTPARLK